MVESLGSLSDKELISSYSNILKEMKKRNMIRSNNVTGDLGEYLASDYYCKTHGLPKLQPAPQGTKNVDALSIKGERYSIKSTTGPTTGVFYGLNPPGYSEPDQQKFEYVIIVILDGDFNLKRINELTWEEFILFKRWHSRMKAWNLSITKELLENTKTIYFSN